ncbi:MAG: hypothetical protein HY674_14470 [Chloroflexi bacterium]|nr:hypothetical protein [Chloroflexota bacterium]
MSNRQLEAILAAMFEAEFCLPEQKRALEQARDALLRAEADRAGIPRERLKIAILSSRYSEYRRQRLAREMPGVPPRLRGE